MVEYTNYWFDMLSCVCFEIKILYWNPSLNSTNLLLSIINTRGQNIYEQMNYTMVKESVVKASLPMSTEPL